LIQFDSIDSKKGTKTGTKTIHQLNSIIKKKSNKERKKRIRREK